MAERTDRGRRGDTAFDRIAARDRKLIMLTRRSAAGTAVGGAPALAVRYDVCSLPGEAGFGPEVEDHALLFVCSESKPHRARLYELVVQMLPSSYDRVGPAVDRRLERLALAR
ncbi:hypothetical protein [Kribbella catacumbae]|uniref:hypothetical protein n=1 Tax=Kribbella catacumbae TaxID=460086 RepID=UPI0003A06BFE|nr:hypothetical protein [Kribbella catacumbae]